MQTSKILEELNYIQGVITKKEEEKGRYFFSSIPKISEKIERKNDHSNQNSLDYLPFESNKIVRKNENKNILEFSFNDTDMEKNEREFFLKTKEFNEKLTNNPNDALIWLEFLYFQEKSRFFTKKTNERQIEILKKAFTNPILKKNLALIFYHLSLLKDSEEFPNALIEYLSMQNENSNTVNFFRKIFLNY